MTDWKLKLYHRMPIHLQTLLASARGYYLCAWRYGQDTPSMVEEYLEHETWSLERWNIWQEEKVAFALHRAATKIPYYREQWMQRRKCGDRASWEYLENWTVLSKDALRDHSRAFLADNINLCFQIVEHTSGTTGKPLTFWLSKDAVRQWYGLFEARWRGWYGLSRHDRWGIFGGQMVTPFAQSKPPFWVWNAGMNQLYFSSYHLAPQNISSYMDAIQNHKLVYLLGYASSLYSSAQLALEQKLSIPILKAVISNAEPLYSHQREVISRAFQCPVYDTYGLSENVCAASECLHGKLHLWPEVGVTEILDDNSDALLSVGKTGRLVCTGLLNKSMPLIRYEVGDRGFLSTETACTCGRSLPILGGIEGRKDDMLLTRDGRRIGRLDPVFKADMPIREAQIIQETLDFIRVKVVPAEGFGAQDIQDIVHRVQQRLGDEVRVSVESVTEIPRTKAGKFQAVVSNLKSKFE